MSRVGKKVITLEKGIEVSVAGTNQVLIKSGNKTLYTPLFDSLELKIEEGKVSVVRKNEETQTKALHGLCRSLIQNAVIGVSQGWSKTLELNGVGYKAAVSGKVLELNLGFSHPIKLNIPEDIEIKVEKQTKVSVSGKDKELVGRTAHQIRSYRPVEPYLGKGVRYTDEIVRRKSGKSGGDKK